MDEKNVIVEPIMITRSILEIDASRQLAKKNIPLKTFQKYVVEMLEGKEIGGFELFTYEGINFIAYLEGTELVVNTVY